ncbi:hypothetical protein, partial [Chelonobacter oris]|uniref:LPD3 domain-containing protein n=1 Tax=Chelonobacter oris TaxID=505317 RepID=UPI002448C56E
MRKILAESMGYFVNYDDAAMGTFLAKKSVGDKEVVISGAYKNSDVTEYKRNPYDYKVVFKLPNGGFVQPKKTNSLDEALAWGNEWLDEQSESSEAPADVQEASEMPSEAVAAGNDGQTATIEPVVVTGKELGDFDTDTEEGKKALRQAAFDHLKGLVGQTVYSSALKADVGFSGSGAKKYKHSSANPIKSLLAVKIKEIIANGIKFKESQESYSDKEVELGIKYHYLKTVVNVDGVSYGARVVVSEDLGGKFHYDLQVKESVDAIMDSLD